MKITHSSHVAVNSVDQKNRSENYAPNPLGSKPHNIACYCARALSSFMHIATDSTPPPRPLLTKGHA